MDTSAGFRAPGRALVGLGISAGFVMAAMGMSVASSAFALGTTNFFDEIALKQGTLRAALAKPSTIDPKNQSDAYARDKPGWQTSENKELKNHADLSICTTTSTRSTALSSPPWKRVGTSRTKASSLTCSASSSHERTARSSCVRPNTCHREARRRVLPGRSAAHGAGEQGSM
eukprot:scaffold105460_cov42-Phaeocystis_antarctica.AAC.2